MDSSRDGAFAIQRASMVPPTLRRPSIEAWILPLKSYPLEGKDGIFPLKALNGPNGPIFNPLKLKMEINSFCDFLDLTLSLDNTHNRITYKLLDKRRAMKVGDKVISDLRNFPHLDILLARTCKLGVVTSQMHRFNRRCFYAQDFINETVAYCRKLIREGYSKPEVLAQVGAYNHWVPSKGRWQRVRAILKRRIQLLAWDKGCKTPPK